MLTVYTSHTQRTKLGLIYFIHFTLKQRNVFSHCIVLSYLEVTIEFSHTCSVYTKHTGKGFSQRIWLESEYVSILNVG